MADKEKKGADVPAQGPGTEWADPRKLYPAPPFSKQKPLEGTGKTGEMNPKPDHGELTYRGSGRLAGKIAFITGADSGIGRAVALAFAREGADVAVGWFSNEEDATTTCDLLRPAGRRVIPVQIDQREEAQCIRAIEQVVKEFGGLDILVNNAAYQVSADKVEDFDSEVWDRIFKTNVYGPFYLCRAALPHLKKRPGANIINTASIQSFMPSGHLLAYGSSKSALAGFTRSLAELMMKEGIRVNAVAPGPVWTPFIPMSMPKEKFETFGQDTPFGRPAQPAELAPLYVWLASPEASYCTAEVFGATGGKRPV